VFEAVLSRSTNQLAERFGLDPGWVTDNVDRLEAKGCVVRRTSSSDRRVETLALTETGRAMYARLTALMCTPPRDLVALSREDLLQELSGYRRHSLSTLPVALLMEPSMHIPVI